MAEEDKVSKVFKGHQARNINFQSCHVLANIVRTNIGPNGTLKMLESETGEIGITKDTGEMMNSLTIIHPTAVFLTRAALSQETMFHDGVGSLVTLIDAILEQAEYRLEFGVHPRILVKGLQEARSVAIKCIEEMKIPLSETRSDLKDYVQSASLTKNRFPVADVVVDAIQCIRNDSNIDLDLVKIVRMKTLDSNVRLVKGIVIDQGFRHELMPKSMNNVAILTLNVSLEMEDTEVNTFMVVADADQKERMMIAARKFVDDKLRKIIDLKHFVGGDMLIVNGKGIDGPSMDILSHANIGALRRVSAKTLTQLIHACGGRQVNCVADLTPDYLGFANKVTEENHRGEKHLIIDEVKHPKAVSIVVSGMNKINLDLLECSVKDGLRSLKQAYDDNGLLPGAGSVEIALYLRLMTEAQQTLEPKNRFGIEVLAEALLAIPRALISNSGFDAVTKVSEMLSEAESGELAAIDIDSGEIVDPVIFGVYDNYCVLRNIIQAAPVVASQLLLVDEIIQSSKPKTNSESDI